MTLDELSTGSKCPLFLDTVLPMFRLPLLIVLLATLSACSEPERLTCPVSP